MSVFRSSVGFTVLDHSGFIVGYATTYEEALQLISSTK
jgi:hypothetical protein